MNLKLANYDDIEAMLAKGHRLHIPLDVEVVALDGKYHVCVRGLAKLKATKHDTLSEALEWIANLV